MANTGFKGIDVRQTGNQLVFRALQLDSAGAVVTSGTTSLSLLELQSDGTFKTYDFTSNTFKTSGMTSSASVASMTHRTRLTDADAAVNLGLWTYALSTLTGFTAAGVYLAVIVNSGASPTQQVREFQYGSAEGNLVVDSAGLADANMVKAGPTGSGTAQTARDIGADTNTLTTRLTATRSGYLDNLSAGPVATSAEVTSIQNNTTTSLIAPANILRPAAGSITLYVRVYLTDEIGNMEAPDAAPTLDVRNSAGTDLTARLGSTTGTLEATGQYRWVYTSTNTDSAEQILFEVTVVEGGATRKKGVTSWVTDNATTDFTSTDRTKLEAVYNKLPTNNIGDQTLLTASIGTPAQAATALSSAVWTNTRAGYLDNLSAGAVAQASTALSTVVWTNTKAGYLDAAVSSASAPTVEQIDAELSANHGNTAWGAATIYVTPLTVTVGIGEATSMGNLVAYLHGPMPTTVLTLTDALGAPINLSAADLTLIGRLTSDHTILFVLRQTDDQISVSGAGNNVVTIESGVDYGESEGQWELFLQNQNDNGRMLGVGGLTVFDAPLLPGGP